MKHKRILSKILLFIILLCNFVYANENANIDSVGVNWGTVLV